MNIWPSFSYVHAEHPIPVMLEQICAPSFQWREILNATAHKVIKTLQQSFGKGVHLSVAVGCPHIFGLWVCIVMVPPTHAELRTTLTEHQLQSHKAAHKVIKVNGEVRISVAGHQNLEDGIIQGEAYQKQKTDSETLKAIFLLIPRNVNKLNHRRTLKH